MADRSSNQQSLWVDPIHLHVHSPDCRAAGCVEVRRTVETTAPLRGLRAWGLNVSALPLCTLSITFDSVEDAQAGRERIRHLFGVLNVQPEEPRETTAHIDDKDIRMFLGWLSVEIPELHSIETPRLGRAWEKWRALMDDSPEELTPAQVAQAIADNCEPCDEHCGHSPEEPSGVTPYFTDAELREGLPPITGQDMQAVQAVIDQLWANKQRRSPENGSG
jgi:hypothetical protein